MSNRLIAISGAIHVQDYEPEPFADNEHAHGNFTKTLFIGDAQPQGFTEIPSPKVCAGGEIWPEYKLTVTRVSQAGDVNVTVDGKLFEGDSCDTTDHDGSASQTFTVQPNTTITHTIHMSNTDEGDPEDFADLTLTVANNPSPF
ncbi:hypothetical protein [Metabacillus sp. Hm71]|uniref:hypothetical protein n=1 Tax=Metabacillus sp. Hm71 TaxID=3450743 RepID=UPI003F433845